MTPKEKAEELVEKFSPLVTTWDCYNDCPEDPEHVLADAKKCSMIAVDELIKSWLEDDGLHFAIKHGYWRKVQKEISLL